MVRRGGGRRGRGDHRGTLVIDEIKDILMHGMCLLPKFLISFEVT